MKNVNEVNPKTGKYNNQQTLTINAPTVSYTVLAAERHEAQRKLSYAAYVIWTELSQNADGFSWKMSKAFFVNECGLSEKGYERAKQELEENGYIVWTLRNEKGNGELGYFNRSGKVYGHEVKKTKPEPVKEEPKVEVKPAVIVAASEPVSETAKPVEPEQQPDDEMTINNKLSARYDELWKDTKRRKIQLPDKTWFTGAFKDFVMKVKDYATEHAKENTKRYVRRWLVEYWEK